ncbi:VWA-like domain-containing protein [Chakrabartyella piscis]|uniref:vWA domain-containing protein n=1 Tax=Chakrabartyella piscis TaxID=2918914 RepID=UPI002958B240|nr:VWA-like domain-containing protein [Chakrabartyella piscis]
MNETHEKLIQIGNHILQNARNQLYLSLRFLDIAFHALPYELNLSTLYVGTDGIKILFNPRYLMEQYQHDPILVNRLYIHMLFHCILRHPFHQGNREQRLWWLASDIAVESIVDGMMTPATKLVISDRRHEIYQLLQTECKVLSAELIYQYLVKRNLSEAEFGKWQMEFWVDEHAFWEQSQEDDENNQNQNEDNENDSDENNESEDEQQQHSMETQMIEEKWQEIAEKMETNLETFAKDMGDAAGDFLTHLKIENRERYDYKQFLEKFVTIKEEMGVDEDTFDYIFYTYGLSLYGNMPLLEALEYKESKKIEELVIAIDTSGSCDIETVRRFLEETYSILAKSDTFFHKTNIHLLQCDTKIQEDIHITCKEDLLQYMENFTIRGSGGTDFRPVFRYMEEMIAKKELNDVKGLIYFTDGYGIFPNKRPSFDTVFVFVDDGYTEVTMPPWAMKVVVSES